MFVLFNLLSEDFVEKETNNMEQSPEERKAFLDKLRNPRAAEHVDMEAYRRYVLTGYDQTVQCAAIQGLKRLGGSEAVLILTERLFNGWGMTTLERTMNALMALDKDGGLFVLSSTLLIDFRFYGGKLERLQKAMKKMKRDEDVRRLARISQLRHGYRPHIVRASLVALEHVGYKDIAYGAIIARMLPAIPSWVGDMRHQNTQLIIQAEQYAEQRVPGIISYITGTSISWGGTL
jgi:hypothetical protein